MAQSQRTLPEPQALSEAWLAFKNTVGVTSIKTEEDYEQGVAVIDYLLDIVEDDEDHPLADVLHYLGDLVERWEDEHVPMPEPPPHEMLRLLMDQHKFQPEDLAGCAPQGQISDILAGKRPISKALAKKLAQRFHVDADLFLCCVYEEGRKCSTPLYPQHLAGERWPGWKPGAQGRTSAHARRP